MTYNKYILYTSLLTFFLSSLGCSESLENSHSLDMNAHSSLLEEIESFKTYARSSTPPKYYAYSVPEGMIAIPHLNGIYFNPVFESANEDNIQIVYQYLYDSHPMMRQMAVAIIGQIESEQAMSLVMLSSLLDPHPAVRMYCVYTIASRFPDTPFNQANDSMDIAFHIACRDPYELHKEFAKWLYDHRPGLFPAELKSFDIEERKN